MGKSRGESKEKKEEVEIRDNSKRRGRERKEERMKIRSQMHRERNLEVGNREVWRRNRLGQGRKTRE